MKTYGNLKSAEDAMRIFSENCGPSRQAGENWAGIFLHWNDGYILVMNAASPDTAPYPYQDAILRWEWFNNRWQVCTQPAGKASPGETRTSS